MNSDKDALVTGSDWENSRTSAEQAKQERLARLREARAEFDTVTVGRGAIKPAKPKSSHVEEQRDRRLDEAPVYRFQIAETFAHDIPHMRQPSAVTTVRTIVNPTGSTGRRVVPYAPDGGTSDALVVQRDEILDPDELLMATIQHATSKRPKMVSDKTVAPNDDLEISKLRDAEDTISYFSQFGSTSAVKYVYLNQAPTHLDFRPYDLQVVLKGQQLPEHYVISATGVVHIKPGQPSEVVSLSDWMKETAMFNVLRRIRFFRNYLVYKVFEQWRKNIRLRLYFETRRKLAKRHFLSKATFAGPTLELHKMAYDLTTSPLFHYDPQPKNDITLAEFDRQQSLQRQKAQQEFSLTLEKMETRLTKLTEQIQQRANVPDLTTMESLEQYLLANSVASGKDKKGSRKMKSMLEAKQEQYERMRELKRSMVEYSMLDSFVRLIDCIASENIFQNALFTVVQLHRVLDRQKEDSEVKEVSFQILIEASEEAMTFKPSAADIEKNYTSLVDHEIFTAINSVTRLMLQKPLKIYFARTPKHWNIGAEFTHDHRVFETKAATIQLIHDDFAKAHERMKMYEENREWFAFINTEWPQIEKEWESKRASLSSTDFQHMYRRFERSEKTMKKLTSGFVGMLFINAAKLRQDLSPRIEAIKEAVNRKLAATAGERVSKLHSYFSQKMKLLNERPTDLRKFAEFVKAMREVDEHKSNIDEDVQEAEWLYDLIVDQNVAVSDEQKVQRQRTLGGAQPSLNQPDNGTQHDQFNQSIHFAKDFKSERMHDMVKELNTEVSRVTMQCDGMLQVLNDENFKVHNDVPEQTIKELQEVEQRLNIIQKTSEQLSEFAQLFEIAALDWSSRDEVKKLFEARHDVWKLLDEYNRSHDLWFETPLLQLDTQKVESTVKEMHAQANRIRGRMTDNGFEDSVADHLCECMKEMKQRMPVIINCGNKHMNSKEHWNKIFQQITGGTYQYSEDLTLNMLHERDIWDWAEVVAEQANMATGEATLNSAVEEIRTVWDEVAFETKLFKEDREVCILEKLDDIIQQLDDHHVQLQTIMASPYISAVRGKVEDWATKLRVVSDVIEEWVTLQKNWMYLEFIFSSDDIKHQLPEENSRFQLVNQHFVDLMKDAHSDGNVKDICTRDGLLQKLRQDNAAIDDIQKKLEDYLETKRVAFPRFYFLSNDELLSILSDVRNPKAVQPHLSKCFDSIAALVFNNDAATEIGGMMSGEGEEVLFDRPVNPVGAIELWLGQIEATMKSSLLMHMRDTVDAYPKRVREEWFFDYPAQCISAVDMIVWTSEVEAAIAASGLQEYHARYHKQIIGTVDVVKRQLSKLQRTLVCTLIVVDVHNRDVVDRLLQAQVAAATDFEWVQQLRYYWEQDSSLGAASVGIHHCSAHLWYGYEYLGNQPRLVITPLTDRAFLTCTSALAMNLGAAPQGPAGTGKTESVKDLGKALARQVVVFNCSDGINYKTMSRMFAGLAQAGAWACFDEFNRIELEVLSVIAQQMLEIVTALGQRMETMDFDGHQIKLSRNFGVFITMNPGYAGRTELPDNLKALFRPICMMIPDYALIAEIMFYSEGFSDARTLAQKMVQLYKLSSEQLSKQDHYDFGMRAVKSILVMAGGLKRAHPDESEDMLLIRAMRDSNVPKFLRDDTILFMALVRDLFPTIEIQEQQNEVLVQYMKHDMELHKLQVVEGFVVKTLQLFDTLIVRHGVMMVGQTYCAKTTIVETLKRSLTNMKLDDKDPQGVTPLINAVHTHVLNPKSVTMGELYGEVNEITREWTDGILSNIARCIKDEAHKSSDRQWIIFDGPVDAIWIENMNTVLDDNKMLCLFNGERIKLPSTATFMFEVQDLRVASPATVSRCGMVFVEPYYLDGGWKPVAKTLVATLQEQLGDTFRGQRVLELLEKLAQPTLDFVRAHCKEWIPTVDAQLVVSCIELLHGFVVGAEKQHREAELQEILEDDPAAPADPLLAEFHRPPISHKPVTREDPAVLFDMFFVMSFVWSFGGNLADGSRHAFDAFARPLLAQVIGTALSKDEPTHFLYDLCVHRPSQRFITWSHIVPDFTYDRHLPYFELFVPTAETTSLKSIMATLSNVPRHVLVNGVTGVGKSVIIQDFIARTLHGDNPASSYEYFTTCFSAQTRSSDLQERLESKLQKIKATLLGPSPGKKAVFFVDDLNMPALERFGASPPIELLRQLMTQRGFFDRKKQPAVFKEIQDVIFLASCGVPGGGRNELTMRLTSRFHLLCQTAVTEVSNRRIFTTILAGFLNLWPAEVRELSKKLVTATKHCYDRIASEKLPTPAKSHYTFNLRDFGKVIQGMLQVMPEVVSDKESVVRLWLHEVSRVFHDRLTDDVDKRWWWQTLAGVLESEFSMPWISSYESLIFGDYMRRSNRVYEEVEDVTLVQDRLVQFLIDYNLEMNKEEELVFFGDAVHHLSRICRICRQPRGNALLVGVGGSGRQTLTRLAAFICGMDCFQISITRSYGVKEFREDLKKVLLRSGCENRHVIFLLSDSQIVKEQFLEDVNNILNTGEVPNLMLPEDHDAIIDSCRKFVKAAGKQETRNVIMAQFVQQCRDCVHVVLAVSPVGEQFRRRLRMFPSLVNCMTIDWFSKWPSEALKGVATRYLDKLQVDEDIKESLANMCVHIHEEVQRESEIFFDELRRHNYTTPTSYLELLKSYNKMLEEQGNIVSAAVKRLQGGLDKLESTQELVDEMKQKIVEMQPSLEQAKVDTERIMGEVQHEQKEAEVVKGQCAQEESAATVIKNEADSVRADCQAALDEAMPAFYAAVDALNALSAKDIGEVKSFPKPPDRVRLVMEAVLVLFGERDLSWESAKRWLGRSDFIRELKEFKKDDILERTIRQLQKYIKNEEFTPEVIAKTSMACKSLCLWVRAIDNYHSVGRTIQPKREQLAAAEEKLAAAAASLEAAQARLKAIEDRVAALTASMNDNIAKKKNLEDEMELCTKRLERAGRLMSGLASEQVRWKESVKSLKQEKFELVGTIALAAGCVAYLGPFTAPFRAKMIASWTARCQQLEIPVVSSGFLLSKIADPVKVRQWNQRGLPSDNFSIENGVIATRSQRWSLCIDPQGQANAWIRAMERENNLKIIKLSEPNFMRTLENAIKVGLPVLLENVEESLDAVLDPVLLRQTFRADGRLRLRLGETEIDYEPSFRFYITTKLPNPHYMPELQIKVTIINFTVTQKGLEEQLLADVVRHERPDLEQRADKTITEIADGKGQLKAIEDRILSLLASSTGNILDNISLIDTLDDAKKTSESVTEALNVAEATQRDIIAARDRYRPVATRGSLIYTVISEISGVDTMYQISLDFFKRLFLQTLQRSEKSDDVDRRVAILLPAVTLDSYNTICRGLFEKDKQLFVFLMVSHLFRASGDIQQEEWNFFLKGAEGRRLVDPDDDKWPEWCTENVWNECTALCEIPVFEDIKNDVWAAEDEWASWALRDDAYNEFPTALRGLSEWQRLLVLKVFREDLVTYGMTRVVGHYLGKVFTESPAFNLDACFEDSSNVSPIIFVLTAGTDPTSTFTEFAERKGFGEKKLMLSLGQDQGPKAQDMISLASKTGQWVYLQNCHVYASWMPSLERILEELMLADTDGRVHKDFRLWLTTMPTPSFPVLVLQSGIKVTKEPPKGLKANIRGSFLQEVTPELWDSCPRNVNEWKRLLFSLSYFHGIIQERRKFGPLGWNIPYEWNQSDFAASIKSLFTYLSEYESVPWDALKYMIGVINYGGRVTDFLDSRCLQTVMLKFFNERVVADGAHNVTPDGVYCIPADVSSMETVNQYLADLPPYEQPELFGLHTNADITYNKNMSRKQLETILSIQPRTKTGGGMSTDDKVLNIAIEFQNRLPPPINKADAHEETYRITEAGTMTSLGTVASQEIDVFNMISAKLQRTLRELQRAIKGEVVMSAQLEAMYNAFLLGRVPEIWHEGGYLSRKPLASWFEDTLARIDFLRDWNDNGPPTSFWLPGLFFPQGFLTGVLQTHSRASKIPIDDIKFRTNVMPYTTPDQVEDLPETGVYVHGLFMEGARFDRDTMTIRESAKGELFTSMPVIWLEPVMRAATTSRADTYTCPVYKTLARAGALSTTGLSTNFVLSVDLDSGEVPPDHWILRGVALICMLDD